MPRSFYCLTVLAALCILAAPERALALKVNDSGPFANMEQLLKRDRQVEIGRAEYVLNGDDPTKAKTLTLKITLNSQGLGYILLFDGQDNEKATKEIVYGKVQNAYVYDPYKIGTVPRGVAPQSKLAGLFKVAVSRGDGVLLHGDTVWNQKDGSETISGTTTLVYGSSVKYGHKTYDIAIFEPSETGEYGVKLASVLGVSAQLSGNKWPVERYVGKWPPVEQ